MTSHPAGGIRRYADAADRPWRNGRGTARDLHEDEGWTLSVATIDVAGHFSPYPGLDRAFVVAAGEVDVTVDGASTRLGRGALATFPGEAAVTAVPLVGPAHAVNVMTRRGAATAVVHVEHLSGPTPSATALVLLGGALRVGAQDLAPLDALLTAAAGSGDCAGALVVVVQIEPTLVPPTHRRSPPVIDPP